MNIDINEVMKKMAGQVGQQAARIAVLETENESLRKENNELKEKAKPETVKEKKK